jgi:hypothetical protein
VLLISAAASTSVTRSRTTAASPVTSAEPLQCAPGVVDDLVILMNLQINGLIGGFVCQLTFEL